MARKPIPIDKLDLKALEGFQHAITGEASLPCALIIGAMLENILMTMLGDFFIKCDTANNLFKGNGGLESYSKCANMAYCLGFISLPILKNLEKIGKVRNLFAHSTDIREFTDPEIAAECKKLTLPKIDVSQIAELTEVDLNKEWSSLSAREQFVLVGTLTHVTLLVRAVSIQRQPEQGDVIPW